MSFHISWASTPRNSRRYGGGLLLVVAAPPTPVPRQPVYLVAQVVARRRAPRQELVVTAREGLAFVKELLPEFPAF